jgi:hypothetical protein
MRERWKECGNGLLLMHICVEKGACDSSDREFPFVVVGNKPTCPFQELLFFLLLIIILCTEILVSIENDRFLAVKNDRVVFCLMKCVSQGHTLEKKRK